MEALARERTKLSQVFVDALTATGTDMTALHWDPDVHFAAMLSEVVMLGDSTKHRVSKANFVAVLRKGVPGCAPLLLLFKTSPTYPGKVTCNVQVGSGTSITASKTPPTPEACSVVMRCAYALRHLFPAETLSISFDDPQNNGFVVPSWLFQDPTVFTTVLGAGLVFCDHRGNHPLQNVFQYLATRCGRIPAVCPPEPTNLLQSV